jgi:sulfur transfer protein SufE
MTEIKYLVSWESDTEFIREDFSTLTMAEEYYRKKLKEGKKVDEFYDY